MNLKNLNISSISRIIAHTIHPKAPKVDAYATHAKEMLTFSAQETGILITRLQEALSNSKKTFQLEFEDLSSDSIYAKLNSATLMDDKEFVEYSQSLADDLAEAHFRTKIPGGYCLIGEGKTSNNERFFFTIKAELQEVFTIDGTTLQLIKDVFLSPAKDFYKIGFFIESSSGYVPFMFDDQFSLQKKDLTEYFYGQFLGLTTDKNDSLKSKNFFSDTKDFIETNITNTKDRLGLLKALTVLYREDTSGILSPKEFSEKYFEKDLKVRFDEMIDSRYPHSFTKDTILIDRRLELQRLSIPLTYSLAIVGNSDSLADVEIIDNPSESTFDNLEPEINSGVIRKVVLVREKKKENIA
jgi:hypothetical protein